MDIKGKCGMIMIPTRSGHMEYVDDDIHIVGRVLTDDGIYVIIKWDVKKGSNNGNDTDNTTMPNMWRDNANTK